MLGPYHEITFRESEIINLDKPHDDALLVCLVMGDVELSRIMIDTGSSVDVLFYDAYKKMDFNDSDIVEEKTPLVGFAGETTYSMGYVFAPVIAGGV